MKKEQIIEILKARKLSIAVIASLILINSGLVVYVRMFQEPQLAGLQDQWSGKRALAAGQKGDVSDAYRQGMADLASFNDRIPPKRDFTKLMMEIFETAANNGLTVKGIAYKPDVLRAEGFVLYGVSMSLDGKYAGIKSFLGDLQCHRGLITVDSVSLSSGSMTEEAVSLKINLSTYLRAEEK
ncbi:MAG: pilus assembly protein PilO [Desulfuromonadales bacterium]|nr:MAG: pilus assembly protein PilO [Desulfuromonadales bacterium]